MTFPWLGKSDDGNTITLRKLREDMFQFPDYVTPDWVGTNADAVRTGAAIDIETTGLNNTKDKIIEIGLRTFKFNRYTGEILALDAAYCAFADPGMPLSAEIQHLTGITDDMVKGQVIDWEKVSSLLSASQIVIAHNASFDRPFIDNELTESRKKIWGCSCEQITWHNYGFNTKKLEMLAIYHGFFTDAHRALNDSDAVVYLLGLKNAGAQEPYLLELLKNAAKPAVIVSAVGAAFEKKDLLKSRKYTWNETQRVWSKTINKDQHDDEVKWLEETIYGGHYRGKSVEIKPVDRFK